MTNRPSHFRLRALAAGGIAAVALAAPAAIAPLASAATPATASCKGISFSVLNNDSSGGVTLPQGKYTVSSPNLACKPASNYFTTFLNKYNHAIPGWTGKQIAKGWGTYTKNNSKTQFTVKWSNAKKPTPPPPATASCKGISFSVLNNDSSGGVTLPQGKYTVSSPNLACKPASNYFTTFLNKYNHAIPGWTGKQIAKGWGTYTKNNSKTQFTVKWSNAKKPTPPPPATASCKGINFSVLNNDSSGGVTLPQGKYTVSSPNLACKPASNYFTTFLNKYNHAIPGWTGKQIAKGWGTYTKNNSKTQFTVKWSNAKKPS